MPLTRSFDDTVRESAQCDPVFRAMLLPDTLDLLLGGEIGVGKITLRHAVNSTIGYEKLGELMGKTPEDIKRMCHPDYDTSVNDLFEIIGHIQRHEGIRLEAKVCSGKQDCESVAHNGVHDEPAEPLQPADDAYTETLKVNSIEATVGVQRAG